MLKLPVEDRRHNNKSASKFRTRKVKILIKRQLQARCDETDLAGRPSNLVELITGCIS